MRTLTWLLWNTLLLLLLPFLPFYWLFSEKFRRGSRLRRYQPAPAASLRGGIIVHSASAGEYEQARPLLRALRHRYPGIPLIATHFSPSGYEHALRHPEADEHRLIPLDFPWATSRFLTQLAPRALMIVKYDLWPNLAFAAARQKVPIYLLAASLPHGAGRLQTWLRPFMRIIHRPVRAVGAADLESQENFLRLLPYTRVELTGDPRASQVLQRARKASAHPLIRQLSTRQWVVAGSSWAADEEVLLPALREHLAAEGLGLLLVPHEPHENALRASESRLVALGFSHGRLSSLESGEAPTTEVLIVDQTGVLAELYALGIVAWVGGGFGQGVHSVLEPAAHGIPILFGPVHQRAAEASALLEASAAKSMENEESAGLILQEWLKNPGAREAAGHAAKAMVEAWAERATDANLDLLGNLFDDFLGDSLDV